MGILGFLSGLFRGGATPPGTTKPSKRGAFSESAEWLIQYLGGGLGPSSSGVNVTEESALRLITVLACTRVISEAMVLLPIHVQRQLDAPARGVETFRNHPVAKLLRGRINPFIQAERWILAAQGHLVNWGNTYAEIQTDVSGAVVALWPLLPDRTRPVLLDDRTLAYETRINKTGQAFVLPRERVLHVAGLGFDGIRGYSVVAMAREGIGLAMAAEKFGAKFFGSGAHPGGVVEHPEQLGEPGMRNLQASLDASYGGLDNSHRTLILEEGAKWHPMSIPPEDAQFLETRNFQRTDICALERVPPHLAGDLSRATFSNIEHQGTEFETYTLAPWTVCWNRSLTLALLTEQERERGWEVKMLLGGLLRGDIRSRYAAYATARQWGWASVNDVREKEGENPIGPEGDVYLQPSNMAPASETSNPAADSLAQDKPPTSPNDEQQAKGAA